MVPRDCCYDSLEKQEMGAPYSRVTKIAWYTKRKNAEAKIVPPFYMRCFCGTNKKTACGELFRTASYATTMSDLS